MQRYRRGFDPCVGKIPWRRKRQSTPIFLPGKSHGQGAWRATVHGVAKSQTRLSEQINHIQGAALPVSGQSCLVWSFLSYILLYCIPLLSASLKGTCHQTLHQYPGQLYLQMVCSPDSCERHSHLQYLGTCSFLCDLRQIKSGGQTTPPFTGRGKTPIRLCVTPLGILQIYNEFLQVDCLLLRVSARLHCCQLCSTHKKVVGSPVCGHLLLPAWLPVDF